MNTIANLPHDVLTITKGPEDGVATPLTDSPLVLGRDPACPVGPRLDITVQPCHARLSIGRGGYRVRRLTSATVLVGGKRAGRILSRTLRSGQVLKAGYSELLLTCSPTGQAATRRPQWAESDAAWAVRLAAPAMTRGLRWMLVQLWALVPSVARHWLLLIIGIGILLAIYVPDVRALLAKSWDEFRAGVGF